MPFTVYILFSPHSDRYYVGQTEDIEARLIEHNRPDRNGREYTRKFAGPWNLVWQEAHATRSEAMAREKEIKKWKSRKALERLVKEARNRLS